MRTKFYYLLCLLLLIITAPHLQAVHKVKIKAIVFDFSGVIAKTDSHVVVEFIAQSFDISYAEAQEARMEAKKARAKEGDEEGFWTYYAKSKKRKLPEHWMEQLEQVKLQALKPIPGMIELVQNVQQQGYQTPLLSNVKKSQAKIKKELGYYDFFHPVLLAYEIGVSKPNPRAYGVLLERLKMTPDEILFIDNKIDNVNAAKFLGIDAIEFENTNKLIESLRRRGIEVNTSSQ